MEPDQVVSVDDIMAAADTRRQAPVEPITTPAAKITGAKPAAAEPETPGDEPVDEPALDPDETPADEPVDEPVDEEPSLEVDGEKLTPAQIREIRAENARAKQSEQDRLAAQYLLDHPEEYERLQRERGARAAPKPEQQQRQQPEGPNPLSHPQQWKYDRFNQYVQYLASQKKTATPQAIQDQVELDHVAARTEQMHADMMAERAERQREKEETAKQQQQWREQQEAHQIAKMLEPLFAKYPRAATPAGRQDVEAHMLRAIYLGERVDYEAIVKRVHGSSMAAVKSWSDRKKLLANGARPAGARGASARGTQAKLKDTMPAEVSSIMEYAEKASRGEV